LPCTTTALLNLNRDRYIGTTCAFDKRAILDGIVDHIISNNGRFLKRVGNKNNTELWVVVSSANARLKTAHAIQYRMRKKALQSSDDVRATSGDSTAYQRAKDTSSSKVLSPKAANCKKTTTECSGMCDRCDRLEAFLRWIVSTQKLPSSPGDIALTKTQLEKGALVDGKTCMESKADHDTDWMALPAPTKSVKEITIQAEDDPVDQLLKMRRNESIISLGPMDLSKSARLNDLFNQPVLQGTAIDPDWPLLSMSFDDQALQLSASLSSLSIASSLPKPSTALERSTSKGDSQPPGHVIVAAPV
jgi:hypothetical protein